MFNDITIFTAGTIMGLGVCSCISIFLLKKLAQINEALLKLIRVVTQQPGIKDVNEDVKNQLKTCIDHMDGFRNKSETKIRRESQLLVDSLRGNKWLQS